MRRDPRQRDFFRNGLAEIYKEGYFPCSVERLIIFEKSPEGNGLSSYEFSREIQQIKSKLSFGIDADTGSLVIQNESEEVIFEMMPDEVTGDKLLGIDCFNQVKFDVEDGRIWMT